MRIWSTLTKYDSKRMQTLDLNSLHKVFINNDTNDALKEAKDKHNENEV